MMKTTTARGLLPVIIAAVGMVLAALNLGGCYGGQFYGGQQPIMAIHGMYYQQPSVNGNFVNNGGVYNAENPQAYNNGGIPAVAMSPNVASNEGNIFVGRDPFYGTHTAGFTLILDHEPDQDRDRPIWYRLCVGTVCGQPSADGMMLGSSTASGWQPLIPPHVFPGGSRQDRTGILRPGNNIPVTVECYTGPDYRNLVSVGGWTVPGGINIPGRFQQRITLAQRYCN